MNLSVEKITDKETFAQAVQIRKAVFVLEQKVDPNDEYDQFEETSHHFLAKLDGKPAGAARWRRTEKGIKLERFAVLKEFRGKGVGQALVQAVLQDVRSMPDSESQVIYLHAQLNAVALYSKFGFQTVGNQFEECNIKHYKMELA